MPKPLDPRKLAALVSDSSNADCCHVEAAKIFLNNDRNLLEGMLRVLDTYEYFLPVMMHLDSENYGPEKWYITFQVYLNLQSRLRMSLEMSIQHIVPPTWYCRRCRDL